MAVEEGTLESEIESQLDQEFGTDDAGAEGADVSDEQETPVDDDGLSPELRADRERLDAEIDDLNARIKAEAEASEITDYRALSEDAKGTFFVHRKDEEAFLEKVEAIERAEFIAGLIAGDTDALVDGYRDADPILQTEIQDALEDNPDRLREVLDRSTVHVVKAPTVEAAEGEGPEPIDFTAVWHQDPSWPITENLEGHVDSGLGEIHKGVLRLDAAFRDEILAKVEEARSLPPSHPWRAERLEEAAGMLSYAKAEQSANETLHRITKTTQYRNAQGQYVLRETDSRGRYVETIIEDPVFAGEAGLINDGPASDGEDFDPESIHTLEDAKRLSPVQWATLPAQQREALLRSASAAMEDESLAMRRGQL